MKAFAIGAVVLGLLLVVLSQMWTSLYPSSWTPEKAEQWATTKDRLHNLSFIVNAPAGSEPPRRHANREEAKREYDQVKATATKLKAEFESAYNTPRTMATIMNWSGVVLLGVGAVGAYAAANKR
jgi:hypothetical protein